MAGGADNDTFRFAARTHSGVGANADVITDFDDFGNDRSTCRRCSGRR